MSRPITAILTRCRHGQPLVQIDSQPFNGLEATPVELRALAQHLLTLADMATKTPTGGKHWTPTRVQIGTAKPAQHQAGNLTPAQAAALFETMFGSK